MKPEMEAIITTAAAASCDQLPEDVVLEILVRVSTAPAALFRCAATCKRWRALIADRSFLRRCWPEDANHPSSSLVGFFNTQPHGRMDVAESSHSLFFVPLPGGGGSILGSRRRFLSSLVPGASEDGVLDGAHEVAARNGLVLVRLDRGYDSLHLAVCDVLAGTCVVLPPIESVVTNFVDCVIFTDADYHRSSKGRSSVSPPSSSSPAEHSAFFKVVVIVHRSSVTDYKLKYNLYTFSSTEARWSAPRKCLEELGQGAAGSQVFLEKDAVVCRGVAHWLITSFLLHKPTKYYTFEVSAETDQATLTELSFPTAANDHAQLLSATADGTLSLLICMHEELLQEPDCIRRLETWTRGNDGVWFRKRAVELKPPPGARFYHGSVQMWPGEKSGKLLVVHDDDHGHFEGVYNVDVETGFVEEQRFRNNLDVFAVPMEIDFPALFATRLG
ncbi:hypothetical protein BRADI_1g29693v3 [Brachypodium distachyon]|uniref:F-box domain-containing protein n=1 Tax=Brachypodium distachyon TaxID=15368 RepID=A0A0Q3RUI1_BRADI|nr:hypothetical protein BRADI_1g29693v3 [Brachypodium distachyon]